MTRRRRRRGWVVDGKGKCGTREKKHPPSLAKAKRSMATDRFWTILVYVYPT